MSDNEQSASGSANTSQDSDRPGKSLAPTPKKSKKEPKTPTTSQIDMLLNSVTAFNAYSIKLVKQMESNTSLSPSQKDMADIKGLLTAVTSCIPTLSYCKTVLEDHGEQFKEHQRTMDNLPADIDVTAHVEANDAYSNPQQQ